MLAGECLAIIEGEERSLRAWDFVQHGAGVELETSSPQEAYASFPHWEPGRPACWDALPWA